MKIKYRILFLLTIALLVICSCQSGGEGGKSAEHAIFPVAPDRIVIGANGKETELSDKDDGYREIVSFIQERVERSEGFLVASLAAVDPESGKHLSSELRKTETFVEFVYDEGNLQAIPMKQAGGEIAEEEFSACRIFFPLTREYHSSFFVGANEDYTKSVTFGILPDKTELISYVCDLIAQENTSE